jgi:hypothetical protein
MQKVHFISFFFFSQFSYVPYRLRTSKTDQGKEFDRFEFYAELATHLHQQGH